MGHEVLRCSKCDKLTLPTDARKEPEGDGAFKTEASHGLGRKSEKAGEAYQPEGVEFPYEPGVE